MRRAIVLLAVLTAPAPAQLVDCVAARVGNDVITLSAVRRHLRIEAFIARRDVDLSSAARRAAAERLIDQLLVRRELEFTRFGAPPARDVEAQLDQLRQARGETIEALAQSLERFGFTLDDLRAEILYQISLLRFVEFRFSPGIQVAEDDIAAAYEKEIVPQARERGAPPPERDDARAGIVRLLTYRKTTAALEQWLAQSRQQVKIQLFDGAFQ
jgi:hypothetical protein